jgi:hypothetical protein
MVLFKARLFTAKDCWAMSDFTLVLMTDMVFSNNSSGAACYGRD